MAGDNTNQIAAALAIEQGLRAGEQPVAVISRVLISRGGIIAAYVDDSGNLRNRQGVMFVAGGDAAALTELVDAVDAMDSRVDTLETTVAAQGVTIGSHTTTIGSHTTTLGSHTSSIAAHAAVLASLGDAAIKNVGTTEGTVAAGNDSRILTGGDPNAFYFTVTGGGSQTITITKRVAYLNVCSNGDLLEVTINADHDDDVMLYVYAVTGDGFGTIILKHASGSTIAEINPQLGAVSLILRGMRKVGADLSYSETSFSVIAETQGGSLINLAGVVKNPVTAEVNFAGFAITSLASASGRGSSGALTLGRGDGMLETLGGAGGSLNIRGGNSQDYGVGGTLGGAGGTIDLRGGNAADFSGGAGGSVQSKGGAGGIETPGGAGGTINLNGGAADGSESGGAGGIFSAAALLSKAGGGVIADAGEDGAGGILRLDNGGNPEDLAAFNAVVTAASVPSGSIIGNGASVLTQPPLWLKVQINGGVYVLPLYAADT